MSNPSSSRVLRPLGAFERTIDLYTHRNPVQFSLALRLARGVSESELRAALGRLQEVHPLLAVGIAQPAAAGGAPDAAVFRRCDGPIHVRVAHGSTWQQEAAFEQTKRIHPTPGPLVRSVLIPAGESNPEAMILLTFAHQITDGRGALQAAHDLAAVLEGTILSAGTMPESQEVLLTSDATPPAPISVDASPAEPPADTDPAPAGTLRPFDATLPILQTAELTAEATRSLVQRAHEESCTVQAALCAAAATALFTRSKQTRIRINVPVDLRAEVGNPRDVAIRFSGATVTLDRTPDTSFWMLARDAAGQLDTARQPQALRAGALGLAAFAPTTPEAAETAMLAATGADIEITNLGVARFEGSTVTAVWGPTMTTQVDGEQILGVVTQGGVLRMVNTTRTPLDGLVTQIAELLTSACHQRTGMVRE